MCDLATDEDCKIFETLNWWLWRIRGDIMKKTVS